MKFSDGFPVRIRFTKLGKVRFISHRDVARAFERAFRIEELPLAFTLGFSPRPKVSFGLALSVGHESVAEYLDVELAREIDLDPLAGALSAALPAGIDVTGATALAPRAPALQEAVTVVDYEVDATVGGGEPSHLEDAVARVLASDTVFVTRTRKGRESNDDIRPALRAISILASTEPDSGDARLGLSLATNARGARPREVLDALSIDGIALAERRVMRTAQWIERDGARWEPLEADALARTVEVRA
jgi:radical SAM-linked protein